MPLFPERREWNDHRDAISRPDPEIRTIARMIASGAFGKSAPICSVGVCVDGEPRDSIEAEVPDDAVTRLVYERSSAGLKQLDRMPHPRRVSAARRPGSPSNVFATFDAISSLTATQPALSDEQIDKHNARVNDYNDRLREYLKTLAGVIADASRLVALPLRLYNDGTAAATGAVVELELPEGVEYWPEIPELPDPPDKPPRAGARFHIPLVPARPEVSLVAQLGRQLSKRATPEDYTQFFKDRGRRILRIHFGKVLQGTFRDRDVRFLRVPPDQPSSVRARVLCEEASRATEAVFQVTTKPVGKLPLFLAEVWAKDLEDDEDVKK